MLRNTEVTVLFSIITLPKFIKLTSPFLKLYTIFLQNTEQIMCVLMNTTVITNCPHTTY